MFSCLVDAGHRQSLSENSPGTFWWIWGEKNDRKHPRCVHVSDPDSAQPQRGECDLVRACGVCSHPLDVSCRKTSILTPFQLIRTRDIKGTSLLDSCWSWLLGSQGQFIFKVQNPNTGESGRNVHGWIFFSFSLLLLFPRTSKWQAGGFVLFCFVYNMLCLFRIKTPCSFPT